MRILRQHIFGLIVPAFLLASGCFSVPNPDYKTRLTKVPHFLVAHFPNQLASDGQSTLITNTDTTSHCIYYFLLQYVNDSALNFDTTNISKQVLAKYNAADTNIISIKRETVTYWNPEKKRYYTHKIRDNRFYYPIPYFETEDLPLYKGDTERIYSDVTNSELSEDFIIYVIDFKPGNYWEGLHPQDYLPKGWENGYSKGIAINKNKNVLVNWFIVW